MIENQAFDHQLLGFWEVMSIIARGCSPYVLVPPNLVSEEQMLWERSTHKGGMCWMHGNVYCWGKNLVMKELIKGSITLHHISGHEYISQTGSQSSTTNHKLLWILFYWMSGLLFKQEARQIMIDDNLLEISVSCTMTSLFNFVMTLLHLNSNVAILTVGLCVMD